MRMEKLIETEKEIRKQQQKKENLINKMNTRKEELQRFSSENEIVIQRLKEIKKNDFMYKTLLILPCILSCLILIYTKQGVPNTGIFDIILKSLLYVLPSINGCIQFRNILNNRDKLHQLQDKHWMLNRNIFVHEFFLKEETVSLQQCNQALLLLQESSIALLNSLNKNQNHNKNPEVVETVEEKPIEEKPFVKKIGNNNLH